MTSRPHQPDDIAASHAGAHLDLRLDHRKMRVIGLVAEAMVQNDQFTEAAHSSRERHLGFADSVHFRALRRHQIRAKMILAHGDSAHCRLAALAFRNRHAAAKRGGLRPNTPGFLNVLHRRLPQQPLVRHAVHPHEHAGASRPVQPPCAVDALAGRRFHDFNGLQILLLMIATALHSDPHRVWDCARVLGLSWRRTVRARFDRVRLRPLLSQTADHLRHQRLHLPTHVSGKRRKDFTPPFLRHGQRDVQNARSRLRTIARPWRDGNAIRRLADIKDRGFLRRRFRALEDRRRRSPLAARCRDVLHTLPARFRQQIEFSQQGFQAGFLHSQSRGQHGEIPQLQASAPDRCSLPDLWNVGGRFRRNQRLGRFLLRWRLRLLGLPV